MSCINTINNSRKITELAILTSASISPKDLIPIQDVSQTETKAIEIDDYTIYLNDALSVTHAKSASFATDSNHANTSDFTLETSHSLTSDVAKFAYSSGTQSTLSSSWRSEEHTSELQSH